MAIDNNNYDSLVLDRRMEGEAATERSATGYAHSAYAHALSEFGEPIQLAASAGWLLQRAIGSSRSYDAMGCYPLFSCQNWRGLAADFEALRNDLVSIAMVPDPFGEYDIRLLHSCFDRVVDFKSHFIIDFERPERNVSKHHRYYARKALRDVRVDVCTNPGQFLQDWIVLYDCLVDRHGLKGIKAFSPQSFARQFQVPGLVVFRASTPDGQSVGAHLWYVQGDVAYSHLAAVNELGYKFSCAYAIYDAAIEYFKGKIRFMDLGSGAGSSSKDDGLTKFKEGWSDGQKSAYFCGRILNPERYRNLVDITNTGASAYFPAYRHGELA
jgi:Acetyltransferase (GNAT) domain